MILGIMVGLVLITILSGPRITIITTIIRCTVRIIRTMVRTMLGAIRPIMQAEDLRLFRRIEVLLQGTLAQLFTTIMLRPEVRVLQAVWLRVRLLVARAARPSARAELHRLVNRLRQAAFVLRVRPTGVRQPLPAVL